MLRYALFIILLACTVPISAHARNQFVTCVQNQLVKLGQNPGPIDGALGKRTRGALAKTVAEYPQFEKLPRISNRFAVTWCRELGTVSFRTRAHMPYYDGLILKSDLAQSSEIEAFIVDQLKSLRAWYGTEFKTRIASRPAVVIAQNETSAVTLARKAAREIGVKEIGEKSIREKCKKSDDGREAFAGAHIIYFCFTQLKDDGRTISKSQRNYLAIAVAHEYFHIIQRDLAADKVRRYYRKGTRPPALHLRPSWLVEGSADYFAFLYLAQKYNVDISLSKFYQNAKQYKRTLSTIGKNKRLTRAEDYSVSLLAARLLVRRSGPQSLLDYWQRIGFGIKHDVAFEQSFDMTRKDFEIEFETLRFDFLTALKFGDNDGVNGLPTKN